VDVNKVLIEMTVKGSRMNQTLKRYSMDSNGRYSPAIFRSLLSEISVDYLSRRERIERIPDNEVVFYIAATCLNMVASSTSKYFKNVKQTINTNKKQEPIWDILSQDKSNQEIELKIQMEKDLETIYSIIDKLYKEDTITWFDKEMFLEYYLDKSSYRQMGRKYNITIRHIWLSVTSVTNKIKDLYNDR